MEQLTKEEFVNEMVAHYNHCCGDGTADYGYAEDVLDARLEWDKIEYGDSNYSWDIDAAHEEANIDMSYWED